MGGAAIHLYVVGKVGIQMMVMVAAPHLQLSKRANLYPSASARDIARGFV